MNLFCATIIRFSDEVHCSNAKNIPRLEAKQHPTETSNYPMDTLKIGTFHISTKQLYKIVFF